MVLLSAQRSNDNGVRLFGVDGGRLGWREMGTDCRVDCRKACTRSIGGAFALSGESQREKRLLSHVAFKAGRCYHRSRRGTVERDGGVRRAQCLR